MRVHLCECVFVCAWVCVCVRARARCLPAPCVWHGEASFLCLLTRCSALCLATSEIATDVRAVFGSAPDPSVSKSVDGFLGAACSIDDDVRKLMVRAAAAGGADELPLAAPRRRNFPALTPPITAYGGARTPSQRTRHSRPLA